MEIPLLQELGLSPNEAKIYHALLTYGGSGVSTISLRAKVHRRNAYDALHRLHKKGLVFEAHGKGEVLFEAVDPGKLMELVREQELKLSGIMPALQSLYQAKKAPELAYIFRGAEGVKNYLREVQKTDSDMHILGAEGAWFDPRLVDTTRRFLEDMKRRNKTLHILFDADAQDMGMDLALFSKHYKFLPEKYDTKATMDIFGDYVVTYTGTSPGKLADDATIFVLYSPELAESYRVWWQLIWDLLPPAKKGKK